MDVRYAPIFTGKKIDSLLGYFGPDADAPFGRYYDGKPISENPSETEIQNYWSFWVALANREQKETLQGMHDIGIAQEFAKAFKGKSSLEVVTGAIKWWAKYYPQEVKEFFQYVNLKKETLRDVAGWNKEHNMKFEGAMPQRVKTLVIGVNPELNSYNGASKTLFQKIFFQECKKALIGGV